MQKIILLSITLFIFFKTFSQDKEYAISVVDSLTSQDFHGRGYVNNGDKIAAQFVKGEFKKFGLKSFGDNYLQQFTIPINTFADTLLVSVNNNRLIPGKDYVLFSSSPSVFGTFELIWCLLDSTGVPQLQSNYVMTDILDKVMVIDMNQKDFKKESNFKAKGIIFLRDEKVWWHVSNGKIVNDYFQLQIVKDKIPENSKTITLQARNKYFDTYQTQNVVAYVEGKTYPDSFFVFTAHYDHLGQMGAETFFPGANDNASGTSMLLDLARHYSLPENQPDFSIAFIAFGAEEVGLLGSGYFTANPLFPLENIKFLINLDMVGSGSEGIKIVNGTVFKKQFNKLVRINSENEYLLKVSERGEAANSDHYPFFQKGVPCFFIYTLGKECKEYHNIYDTPKNVPFTEYEDLFRLLTDFIGTFK
ncbi:MAG: M28 family peptidase [Bacteroidetes bacterium]|nr:M28 family peptidase [Bacteroidota bacterium]MBL7102855.1 M28 family peptidase [Bacteroidales bacterium]